MKSYKDDTQETRIAVLENTMLHIHETLERLDKRMTSLEMNMNQRFDKLDSRLWQNFYWMIGGFTAIIGLIAKLQHWI